MASLPCILCDKTIEARFGSNTTYYPPTGKTYACCNGGCGRPQGAYDTTEEWARIERKSDEERQLSEVPASDRLR